MNRVFSLDTDPVMSWGGTRKRATTNVWDITGKHGFDCLCDEHKNLVDESGRLDDAKQIVS